MSSVTTNRRRGTNASAAIKVACITASTANLTLSGEQTVTRKSVRLIHSPFRTSPIQPPLMGIFCSGTFSTDTNNPLARTVPR